MLSAEESKPYFKGLNLSDLEVENIRNAAHSYVNEILDQLYEQEEQTDN